jgi:hypothetical protein
LLGAQQSGFAMRLDCFLQSENLAGPIAAHQIQPQRFHSYSWPSRCGIVSKRKDSAYRFGRSPDWLKMKNADAPAVKPEEEEEWGR